MNASDPAAGLSRSEMESRAREALARGDFGPASNLAKALVLDDQNQPEGYFLLGLTAAEIGEVAKAVPLLQAAVQRGPCAEHLAQLARLYSMTHRDGPAADAAREALLLSPKDAHTLDTVGCVLARIGDHEGSLAPFRQAVAAEPKKRDFRYNLGAACGFTGRVAEARTQYEAILTADPNNARVHYALALLSRATPQDNHIPQLKAALGAVDEPADKLRIGYALAKELEDIGDRQAFDYLRTANEQHKRDMGYAFSSDEAIFDAIEEQLGSVPPDAIHTPATGADGPIFIIGMPRTGTTLVDRILSSHPDVQSAGELQSMPVAVKRLAGTASRTVIDPQTVEAASRIDPAALRAAYLESASHHLPATGMRFIDKLPANFLYVGHIMRAMPDARIVCLRRNPMDTVWSNFKNLFASQSMFYAYSYDLLDTAKYYARFARMMDTWQSRLSKHVLQLSYEELVANQEHETRSLLEHCGLTWDDACLQFHENRSAVATPSAAQVRRALNSDAVGKWRRYEHELQPVRQWFCDHGIIID
ncbi:MAG: sulfotransferase [Alteraurantiacibacter sp.]